MARKIIGFRNEEDFRKVAKATRKVLKMRRTGSRRRRQGPVPGNIIFLGKANANIASRTSGSVSVYKGTLGSETDTGSDITAFNITDQQADSGAWVEVTRMAGGYAIKPVECPA